MIGYALQPNGTFARPQISGFQPGYVGAPRKHSMGQGEAITIGLPLAGIVLDGGILWMSIYTIQHASGFLNALGYVFAVASGISLAYDTYALGSAFLESAPQRTMLEEELIPAGAGEV